MPGQTAAEMESSGRMVVERDVMVPMRDGICLATDIYRPGGDASSGMVRVPALLERTPYDKKATPRSELVRGNPEPRRREDTAAAFVARGYAVAVQDCRGRYASEGRFEKYLGEGPDGYDTVVWLASRSWCDGKVGTMGLSYAAHVQAALASLNPPGLAAMFLDSGGFSNAYQGGIRQGGAFELKQLTWAYRHARLSPEAAADPLVAAALDSEDIEAWFHRLPWRQGHSPLRWCPEYEDYVLEQWSRGSFDDFWRQPGIYAQGFYKEFADVPMLHMSSWYDPYPRTATENYLGLSRLKHGPVRLVLGPWTHGNRSVTWVGDVDFGDDATLDGSLADDYTSMRLRWFDRWLKDISNGVDDEPAVRYFRMGGGSGRKNAEGRMDHGGTWCQARDWPVPGSVQSDFYLHSDGTLTTQAPAGQDPSVSFAFDPLHPVPSIGGTITSGLPVMVGGAFDQVEDPRFFGSRAPYLPLASRPDVLVFQTGPLEHGIEVTGSISAHLWISSDCPDTDFTIKLVDVYPPNPDYPRGFAMNLTDGILRVRYRDSWESPSLMEAGKVYEVVVEAFPTSNLFAVGHRLRLDVSSSNFPHFDVNPNTGEPEGQSRYTRTAINTVHMDRARPSRLILPIVGSGQS
jgi:uncharacterized protein